MKRNTRPSVNPSSFNSPSLQSAGNDERLASDSPAARERYADSRNDAEPRSNRDQSSDELSHDDIARRAYSRWEESDRSPGRDAEHWYAAENDLRRGRSRDDADSSLDEDRRA